MKFGAKLAWINRIKSYSRDAMNIPKNSKNINRSFSRLFKESLSAKKTARLTEIFLKNITVALPQYVFWKNMQSIYLGCNKNFAQLVGFNSPEDIIGKTDNDLNWQPTGHISSNFQQGDQETIAGQYITNQEEILALANGHTMITLVSKLPIIDNGRIIGVVGYFTDISEIKQKEQELIKAKQLAESANQAKSVFIANISHDLRTPLTGMLGMTKIICKELNSAKGREAANNLLKAGHILLDLLNEVLEITKLDAGELPIHEIKFSIKEVLNNLVILVMPSIKEKGLQFTVDYDTSIPKCLIGDQKRIHRILLNLISNAIKFTAKGELAIMVKLAQEQARHVVLEICIKDTGIGIPVDKQQIIFSRFQRLDTPYKGIYKGSGLGLSIVKQFIAEIDGEIYLTSDEGKGSIFTCIIPLKKPLLEKSTNKSAIQLATSELYTITPDDYHTPDIVEDKLSVVKPRVIFSHAAKILLIEDNEILQMATKDHLAELGCIIDIAASGAKALQLMYNNKYDLVLIDIGLPDQNGCEVSATIREWEARQQQYTPIIALTAHVNDSNKQECLSSGIELVLTKPLTDGAMIEILETFVYQRQAQQKQEK
jgi:PAS domain S-box-containing protein